MKDVLFVAAVLFAFLVFAHWFTGGSDEIIEGPSKTPDISVFQPSESP